MQKSIKISFILFRGVAKGKKGNPFRNWKSWCRKVELFPLARRLLTDLPKLIKNSIFDWVFIKNLQSLLKLFQQFVFFPNTWKINALVVKFFWKYAKIMHFLQLPEGASPRTAPTRPTPKSVSSRTTILATPMILFAHILFKIFINHNSVNVQWSKVNNKIFEKSLTI